MIAEKRKLFFSKLFFSFLFFSFLFFSFLFFSFLGYVPALPRDHMCTACTTLPLRMRCVTFSRGVLCSTVLLCIQMTCLCIGTVLCVYFDAASG